MSNVLYCTSCDTKESVSINVRMNHVHSNDMGGGWGRPKVVGNCPKCNYMYAVLFMWHNLEDEGDSQYTDYYMETRHKEFVEEYDKKKEEIFNKELEKLRSKFNMTD